MFSRRHIQFSCSYLIFFYLLKKLMIRTIFYFNNEKLTIILNNIIFENILLKIIRLISTQHIKFELKKTITFVLFFVFALKIFLL